MRSVSYRDDPDRLIGARVGSPLSSASALAKTSLHRMCLRCVRLQIDSCSSRKVSRRDHNVGLSVWNVSDTSGARERQSAAWQRRCRQGNYRHHMLKEIHEQPKVIRDTLEGRLTKTRVLEPAFGVRAGEIFDRVKSVTIVACGSSFYAASIAKCGSRVSRTCRATLKLQARYRYRGVAVAPKMFVTIFAVRRNSGHVGGAADREERGLRGNVDDLQRRDEFAGPRIDLALMLEAGAKSVLHRRKRLRRSWLTVSADDPARAAPWSLC